MRCAFMLVALAACHDQLASTDSPLLTQTDANTLVDVTTEVAKLIDLEQPHDANKHAADIRVNTTFECRGGGTGHLGGVGHYVPEWGKDRGPTTFDLKVSLADCAFDAGSLSAGILSAHAVVQTGSALSNVIFRGEVSWPPALDACEITLKFYGTYYDNFEGSACAVEVTPDSIALLPP